MLPPAVRASCGTKERRNIYRVSYSGSSPSHARILPICYKPSISDHPSGLHEQHIRTRLISPETHETHLCPAELSTLRYPCLPARQEPDARMNILCASFSHHTLSALMCISLTGGRGLKVARAACVLHTTFCTSVHHLELCPSAVCRSLLGALGM